MSSELSKVLLRNGSILLGYDGRPVGKIIILEPSVGANEFSGLSYASQVIAWSGLDRVIQMASDSGDGGILFTDLANLTKAGLIFDFDNDIINLLRGSIIRLAATDKGIVIPSGKLIVDPEDTGYSGELTSDFVFVNDSGNKKLIQFMCGVDSPCELKWTDLADSELAAINYSTASQIFTFRHTGSSKFNIQADGAHVNSGQGFYLDSAPSLSTTTNIVRKNSDGQIGIATSSKRFKKNIRPLEIDTSKIFDLEPITYDHKNSNDTDFGFIAEEAVNHVPGIVSGIEEKDENGKMCLNPFSINYDKLSVLVLAELKKLKSIVELQAEEIKELKNKIQGGLK